MGKMFATFCFCVGVSLFMSVSGEQFTPWKVYNSSRIYFTASFSASHVRLLPENVTHLYLPNSGFKNITEGTFPALGSLELLTLTYNSIESVAGGSFRALKNLTDLSLAMNVGFFENGGDCKHGLTLSGKAFDGLQNLRVLNISFIGLRKVSRQLLSNLTSLETLSLARNCFGDYSLENDSFVDLVNLRVLDLSYAMITFLPTEMFSSLAALEVLNMQSSQLLKMPGDALAPLANLRDFELGGNFSFEVKFGEEFKNLSALQTFTLKGCYAQNPFEHQCRQLEFSAPAVCNLRTEKLVITQDLGLKSDDLRLLLEHLPVPRMKTLILNWVDASSLINTVTFGGCVGNLSGVTHLDLSHTNLGTIKDRVFSSFSGLQILDLSKNKLSVIQKDAFYGLENLLELDLSSNSLTKVPNLEVFKEGMLKTLRLSNNELHRVISRDTFTVVPSLRELFLDNTAITEITLEALQGSQLKVLDLSNNYLIHLSKLTKILSNLTSLEHLNLAGNIFINVFHMYNGESMSLSSLKNLKYLNMNECPINWRLLVNMTSLEELHLDNIQHGEFLNMNWNNFGLRFPKLVNLSLDGSRMGSLNATTMSTMPNLKHLSLQRNGLDELNRDAFVNLTKLETLDVSRNTIKHITGAWNMKYLTNISLYSNMISSIDGGFLNEKQLPNLEFLDLSKNSFSCDCDLEWFQIWTATDRKVKLYNSEKYRCSLPSDTVGSLSEFEPRTELCRSFLITKIVVSLSCVVVAIAVVIAVMVYRRWYIRYACFLFRCKMRGYREMVDIEENAKEYDVFVSYNSDDQNWVLRTLVPQLESKLKFRVCVDFKNFIPGKFIVDNIMDSIQDSRKTILVLTPNFVKSEWCFFEMEMALHRLFDEGRDVVILVLLEPIADGDLPRRLRKLFTKKTYIEWPQEECETAQDLFWAKVESAVKVPAKVDRIHNL